MTAMTGSEVAWSPTAMAESEAPLRLNDNGRKRSPRDPTTAMSESEARNLFAMTENELQRRRVKHDSSTGHGHEWELNRLAMNDLDMLRN